MNIIRFKNLCYVPTIENPKYYMNLNNEENSLTILFSATQNFSDLINNTGDSIKYNHKLYFENDLK